MHRNPTGMQSPKTVRLHAKKPFNRKERWKMDDNKLKVVFRNYEIELSNDKQFELNSSDNNYNYDFAYHDEEALNYQCSQHAIKLFIDGQLYKSAVVCAIAGGTIIHSRSAIVDNNNIFICCANKVFSLSLPDLKLNWITEVGKVTCFGIYQADNGLFTHGEMTVARLDHSGTIIWNTQLRDIIVNVDENREQEEFVMHDTYISLMDFNGNKYQLGFDGKFISEQLSEQQLRFDIALEAFNEKRKKTWWKFWA